MKYLLLINLIVFPTMALASEEYPLDENVDAIIKGLISGRRAVQDYGEAQEVLPAFQEYVIDEEPTELPREKLKVKARVSPSIDSKTKCREHGWGDNKIRCNTRFD